MGRKLAVLEGERLDLQRQVDEIEWAERFLRLASSVVFPSSSVLSLLLALSAC